MKSKEEVKGRGETAVPCGTGNLLSPRGARLRGDLTKRGMSLGVNRPFSPSFWGVVLVPSPCKPQCWRILLKT